MADLQRAYSLFHVKAVNDAERVIEGFASTPTVDRGGDIMDPNGAVFKLPMPLLWQHKHDKPLGEVFEARVLPEGVWIKARIAAAGITDWIDEAWALISARLVKGFSIGWMPLEAPKFVGGNAVFARWEWFETSAVTIPMNAETTIAAIKSLDAEHMAASGLKSAPRPTITSNTPGASGTPAVRLLPSRSEQQMKSTADQIASYKSTRDQKFTERAALMTKAADEGRTLDEAESQAYDTLDTEIKSLDTHIKRLEALQEQQKASATAVAGHEQHAAAASRGAVSHVSVKSQVPAGIEFARAVICKALAYREGGRPIEHAKERYPDADRLHAFLKATIPGGTTTHVTYAAPLVDPTNLASEFIEFLRPETIVGKFGTGNYPSLRRVPFNVRMNGQTSGGDAYWVGEGAPKPLTKFDFNATTLGYTKIASIAVLTDELVRFSSPSAEALVRDALVAANVERADIDFIDPSQAAVANVSPASITNGLSALTPSGTSADAARSDIARIIKSFLDENNTPASMVLIMPMALALSLSVQVNSLGQPEFPGLTMRGGTLLGIPVITSQYAANRSGAGNLVIAVNASDIFLADDGQVTVDVSREASLQMLDNPTNSSATGTATSMVSMFQTNSMAIRAERYINWAKRRASAVVYMDDVNWGSIGSPA